MLWQTHPRRIEKTPFILYWICLRHYFMGFFGPYVILASAGVLWTPRCRAAEQLLGPPLIKRHIHDVPTSENAPTVVVDQKAISKKEQLVIKDKGSSLRRIMGNRKFQCNNKKQCTSIGCRAIGISTHVIWTFIMGHTDAWLVSFNVSLNFQSMNFR